MGVEPATIGELDALAKRLMNDYESRFTRVGLDLDVGRMRWLFSRGIGLEINGEWNSFIVAKRRPFRRGWTVLLDLQGLEQTVRAYLDAQLRLHQPGHTIS